MSFVYTLPSTKSVNLPSFLLSESLDSSHFIALSSSRNRLRALLKASKRGHHDYSSIIAAVEEYLPQLNAVIKGLENEEISLREDPTFVWRSPLSAKKVRSSNKLTFNSFYNESALTHFLYTLALSNYATHLVNTQGAYEHSRHLPSEARKQHDESINQAAEIFCKAAGIAEYLHHQILPRWHGKVPAEMSREVISGIGKICMADAERLAIRRLLSKSAALAVTTTAPGPPLPKGHPSPSLLSKLYLNVHDLYSAARASIKSHNNGDNILQDFRDYVRNGRAYALGCSYKWLGIDAGESGDQKLGESITWLRAALKTLEDTSSGKLKHKIPGKSIKVGELTQKEIESVRAFLDSYSKLNDSVVFAPIPDLTALQAKIPSGRSALSIKKFAPAPPAFSTNTLDMQSLDIGDDGDSDSEEEQQQTEGRSNYF